MIAAVGDTLVINARAAESTVKEVAEAKQAAVDAMMIADEKEALATVKEAAASKALAELKSAENENAAAEARLIEAEKAALVTKLIEATNAAAAAAKLTFIPANSGIFHFFYLNLEIQRKQSRPYTVAAPHLILSE